MPLRMPARSMEVVGSIERSRYAAGPSFGDGDAGGRGGCRSGFVHCANRSARCG